MSAFENVVGGKLKLKGKALNVKAGGLKKKKKHKHRDDDNSEIRRNEIQEGSLYFICYWLMPLSLLYMNPFRLVHPYTWITNALVILVVFRRELWPIKWSYWGHYRNWQSRRRWRASTSMWRSSHPSWEAIYWTKGEDRQEKAGKDCQQITPWSDSGLQPVLGEYEWALWHPQSWPWLIHNKFSLPSQRNKSL